MRNLLMVLGLAAALTYAFPVRADDANPYGERGRTILSAGAYAYRARAPDLDPFDHRLSWALGLHLTVLHFVAHNIAVGGTVLGSLWNDPAEEGPTRERTMGADVDAVWHLPLTGQLSLRFWGYAGVRRFRTTTPVIVSEPIVWTDGTVDVDTPTLELRRAAAVVGFAPQLLFHLSPSLALGLGPNLTFTIPVAAQGVRDLDVRFDSAVSYSFGPDSEERGSRREDVAHFSERGRTALIASFSVGDRLFANVGFVRFVRARVGYGAYAIGGARRFLEQQSNLRSAGGGVQALVDVPLLGSTSLTVFPQAGYLWQGYKALGWKGSVRAHELQLTLRTYFTMHLHEAVVIGLGPELSVHRRLADAGPEPSNKAYLQAGLSSVLIGSF